MSSKPSSPPKPKRPPSPLRDFLQLLWLQALFAVPFALFFGTIFGNSKLADYIVAYKISVCLSYGVGLGIWSVTHLLVPRLALGGEGTRSVWQYTALYTGGALLGSTAGALVVHFFVVPGFLGNLRSILVLLMFTILFSVLAIGISLAASFYRKAIEHVKSEQELHLARRIQRSFLISQFPERPRLEVHAINVSSKEVSGDFYDVVPAGENAFLVAIADVAGKGVPAALLSSMLQASLRTQANAGSSVGAILANINTLVYRSTAVHQFATFFLARVDEDSMRLTFSNAGHNFPVVFSKGGGQRTLEKGGTVIGILDAAAFEEEAIALVPGDRIVLYTDGISEAANPAGEMFGEQRLNDLIEALPAGLSAQQITERILEGVRAFLDGVEAGDDMTVLVLRVLEDAPARDGALVTAAPAAALVGTGGPPA